MRSLTELVGKTVSLRMAPHGSAPAYKTFTLEVTGTENHLLFGVDQENGLQWVFNMASSEITGLVVQKEA